MKRGTALKWAEILIEAGKKGVILDYSCLGYVKGSLPPMKTETKYLDEDLCKREVYMCPYGVLTDFILAGNWDHCRDKSWDKVSLSHDGNKFRFPEQFKKSCKMKVCEIGDNLEVFDNMTVVEFMEVNFNNWIDIANWISDETVYPHL